jgi:hypothetical protein
MEQNGVEGFFTLLLRTMWQLIKQVSTLHANNTPHGEINYLTVMVNEE